MSELDPNGVEAAAVAMTGAPFPSKRSLAKAEAAITAYLSAVSPLSDGDGWQPIETAKKDGSRMLLWTGSDYVFIGKWEVSDEPDDELDGWWGEDGSWWEPHHWHSLPAPPRDEVK